MQPKSNVNVTKHVIWVIFWYETSASLLFTPPLCACSA